VPQRLQLPLIESSSKVGGKQHATKHVCKCVKQNDSPHPQSPLMAVSADAHGMHECTAAGTNATHVHTTAAVPWPIT
jgi:hypothetical protein